MLLESLRHLEDQQIDDLPHLRRGERLEDHYGIDAVEELGTEGLLELVHDLLAHLAVLFLFL